MVQHGIPQPPSVQIAEMIRSGIERETYAGRLPPVKQLATAYGTSTNTIQKALRILKQEGLITSVPGYGTFVAGKV